MIFRKQETPEDPTAAAYVEAARAFNLKGFSPEQGPLIAIDTETTGLRVGKDRMLSAGLVIITDNAIQITRTYGWYIAQPDAQLKATAPVHGIVPQDLESGLPEPDFLRELLPLLHGGVVVGHHVRFDAAMLDDAMKRHFGIPWQTPLIDTAQLATQEIPAFHRTGYAHQPPPSLDEVCSQMSVYPTERHSAWGDAFTTAELYLLLCARIRQRLERALKVGDLPITHLHPRLFSR